MTLIERKILGILGNRLGPNKTSITGLFQPMSDAMKLGTKNIISLRNFSYKIFYIVRRLILAVSLSTWAILYLGASSWPTNLSCLILLILISLNSLISIILGWRTFRKYSLIGSLRTVRQLISYEAPIYLCLMCLIYESKSMELSQIRNLAPSRLVIISHLLILYVWASSMLAEVNRTPFDFTEGERELVRGFNTEFGSACFTLIFLSEYSSMLIFSALSCLIFRRGELLIFLLIFTLILWVRGVLPRYRFDKLMSTAWKGLIPGTTIIFLYEIS